MSDEDRKELSHGLILGWTTLAKQLLEQQARQTSELLEHYGQMAATILDGPNRDDD